MKALNIFSSAALLLSMNMPAFALEPIEILIKDHKFSPSEITIPKNTKVKLIVKNMDATAEEFESHSMHREKIISGHGKATIFIGPLDPGSYEFFGEFNPKTAQGKVIVK